MFFSGLGGGSDSSGASGVLMPSASPWRSGLQVHLWGLECKDLLRQLRLRRCGRKGRFPVR